MKILKAIGLSVLITINTACLAVAKPTGYLSTAQEPNSYLILPPAPTAHSPRMIADKAVHQSAKILRGTSRWKQAQLDADLHFPFAAGTFSCALGIRISKKKTPALYRLLQRTLVDAAVAVNRAKTFYRRERPFVHYNETSCTPKDEAFLRQNGSYPSGHSAIGWVWALTLAEVAPDRENALLLRGREFTESRVVCDVHWYSDTLMGMLMGSTVFARLNSNPAFLADVAAARKEYRAMNDKSSPQRNCAWEQSALNLKWARI